VSTKLDRWPALETTDVRRLAGEGMTAREIARLTDCTLGSILSAAPDLFDGSSNSLDPGPGDRCQQCEKMVEPGSEFCRSCRRASRNAELIDKVRVMGAANLSAHEMAEELEVKVGMVRWAMGEATRRRLHRQKGVRRR
jgi:DNA-directed RNA polymerase specialized sigma24 family protein